MGNGDNFKSYLIELGKQIFCLNCYSLRATLWRLRNFFLYSIIFYTKVYIVAPDGENRFKFYKKPEAFEKASALCAAEGAKLVKSDDSETTIFLKNTYGKELMWIGAKYNEALKTWFWINDKQIDDSFWNGATVPRGNNLCLISSMAVSLCTQILPFICQRGKELSPKFSYFSKLIG